jgi:hypothetical protein
VVQLAAKPTPGAAIKITAIANHLFQQAHILREHPLRPAKPFFERPRTTDSLVQESGNEMPRPDASMAP